MSARSARERLDILFDTCDLIAVAKPAGLATIPGRDSEDCVIARLSAQIQLPCVGSIDPRLRVIHRLDKDTSGVLMFAKNAAAQRAMCDKFRRGEVHKEYIALVRGRVSEAAGTIDAPLTPHPKCNRFMAIAAHGGKQSITDWRVEERFRDFTLVRCFPRTGRTHQIRVHLLSIGHPLAIDPLYNAPRENADPSIYVSQLKKNFRLARGSVERPLIDRLTLHAEKLSFKNLDGIDVIIESPLSKDFRATLSQLRKWSITSRSR